MRLTISHQGCDRTNCAARNFSRLQRTAGLSLLLPAVFLLGVPVVIAAPAVTRSKLAARRGGSPIVAQSSVIRHHPEMAVVFDDTYRAPAKDLQLNLEGERRADAAARYVSGLLEEDGDPDGANQQYLKSLALDPGNAELSIKLAQDYVRHGDVPGAINLLKDTIKAAPKAAKPYLALGYIYYTQQNKADLAQKFILQALDLDPARIQGYDYLKTIYSQTNQAEKIPALLDRAAKTDTDEANYWLYLGKMFIEQYLNTESVLSGEPLRKTSEVFQKAFNFGKDDADTVDKIGDFFVATNQYDKAIPVYERVIDIDPGPKTIAARENLARCYEKTGAPDKQAEALEGIIKVNAADAHAYELLAKLYEQTNQPDKAIYNYEQSLLTNPNYVEGYERVANLLVQRKQVDRAVALLTDARKRFPGSALFSFLLAFNLERAKQHQQALAIYEQAELEAQRAMPALLDAQFYFEYGVAAEQAGLYDRAGLLLKKALALEDNTRRVALMSNYLGYMWVDHNMNLEEGGDLIKKALEIDPENGAYLDSLGWYYYRTDKFEEASTELAKAIQNTQPEDASVYEHLGDTYLKLNEPDKAVVAWQKAVELDDKNPNLADINKKIEDTKAAVPATPSPSPVPKG